MKMRYRRVALTIGSLVLIAASVLAVGAAEAGLGPWKRSHLPDPAPSDTQVPALALDPQHSQTVYATTDDYGFFKSTNGGKSWQVLIRDVPGFAVAVDPTSPGTVYFGGNPGGGTDVVSKSTDGGKSWQVSSSGLQGAADITALAVDPVHPKNVYAGSLNSLFKSTDAGRTWQAIKRGLPRLFTINAVAIDPERPATVYVGTYRGESGPGAFRSSNGGRSWLPIGGGLPTKSDVSAIVFDPQHTRLLYAGTSKGVFRSSDEGKHWTGLNVGLTASPVAALAIAAERPTMVYAGTHSFDAGGVFKSANGGRSWQPSSKGLNDLRVNALAVSPDGRLLYVGTDDGFYRATAGG